MADQNRGHREEKRREEKPGIRLIDGEVGPELTSWGMAEWLSSGFQCS